jgi:hypothetical protein
VSVAPKKGRRSGEMGIDGGREPFKGSLLKCSDQGRHNFTASPKFGWFEVCINQQMSL